jgi:hypothetical protein
VSSEFERHAHQYKFNYIFSMEKLMKEFHYVHTADISISVFLVIKVMSIPGMYALVQNVLHFKIHYRLPHLM